MPGLTIRRKWRPPLALVVGLVACVLVALPVVAITIARLTDNQFVRETERSLLAQAAVLAEVLARDYAALDPAPRIGQPLYGAAKQRLRDRYHPVEPTLSVHRDVLEPPRDGYPTPRPLTAPYDRLADSTTAVLAQVQKTTLAGYSVTDAFGRVFAASGATLGYSIANRPEVSAALQGRIVTTLRYREAMDQRHLIDSISRDTSYRVFVAHPIIVADRVVGALYLSRTPLDLRKFAFRERFVLGQIAAAMLAGAALVGFLLWRLVSGPIRALVAQGRDVASGRRPSPEPLEHYGVRELATLGHSILSMAGTLTDRSDAIRVYTAHVTHELKSPVTAILGAVELLEGDPSPERRTRLLQAIKAEGHRMDRLLTRLRELAKAQIAPDNGQSRLEELLHGLRRDFPGLTIDAADAAGAMLPMPSEPAGIVLSHLLRNAQENGAAQVTLSWEPDRHTLRVSDDGQGISGANRARIMEPFFTTRRETGGTGMGLTIVAALLEKHGGRIVLRDTPNGASFDLSFQTGVSDR